MIPLKRHKEPKKRPCKLPKPQKTVQVGIGLDVVRILDVGLSIYPVDYTSSLALLYEKKQHGAVVLLINGKKMTFNKPILEIVKL